MSGALVGLGILSCPPIEPFHKPPVAAAGVAPHVEDQQGHVSVLPAAGGEPLQLFLALWRVGIHISGLQRGDAPVFLLREHEIAAAHGFAQRPVQLVPAQAVRQIAPVPAHGEKAVGDGSVRADGGLHIVLAQPGGVADVYIGHIIGVERGNQVAPRNCEVSIQHRPLQRQIQGRRQPDEHGAGTGTVLQPLNRFILQLFKYLIAAEVLIGPVGGAQESKEHFQILPGLLQGEVVHHIAAGQQYLYLLISEGVVLVGEVRRPGGDVQGLPVLDDGPPCLVDLVQKGVEVHRRGRGGRRGRLRRGGGRRSRGAPRQQGQGQRQGQQLPFHFTTLPLHPFSCISVISTVFITLCNPTPSAYTSV